MERITSYAWAQTIGECLDIIPEPIAERLEHVDFLVDTDPVAAGLLSPTSWYRTHPYADGPVVAACSYPWNNRDRSTTVILNLNTQVEQRHPMVLHELGHALHAVLGFEHVALPVTEYATNNEREAFAEAFKEWFYPDVGIDYRTAWLFHRLARGDWSERAL